MINPNYGASPLPLTVPADTDRTGLTEADRALLEFEGRHWRAHTSRAAKSSAIFTAYGILPAGYYQRLNMLIDTEEALALDPLLVNALRRIREARRRAR